MTNNTNDFSKRTAAQVASILKANGLVLKCENLGDGKTFSVLDTTLKTRIALKKCGFILNTSNQSDKYLTFKTN
jgi:uncharacterized protein (DUF983 family)